MSNSSGGGVTARRGFGFQDLVLAQRVLEFVEARRVAKISSTGEPTSPTFGVEAQIGDDGPDWDLIQTDSGKTTVEEVKSGTLDAEDRDALWRRVRRTLAVLPAGVPPSAIVLRVTTNRDAPLAPYWRELHSKASSANSTWPAAPDGRRRPVRNAEDLASEALAALTAPDPAAVIPPVPEQDARELLGKIEIVELDRAALEQSVTEVLGRLSSGLAVQELHHALRGAIGARAEQLDDSQHRFVVDELLVELSALLRVADVDAESARTWRELESLSTQRIQMGFELPSGGLKYVDWRRLHTETAAVLGAEQCTAILGRGGVGKSVILENWLGEQSRAGALAVFLAGVDLAHIDSSRLSEAFRLGAFLAKAKNAQLVVAVDAIENCGEQERLRAVLACLAQSGATSVVTCRASAWLASRGSQDALPGWRVVELDDWPEELVRRELNVSVRPGIGAELVRLLRTPLLLDLFLRTFGRDATVPAGLQSRHAVLSAYWKRRVLPTNDARSNERALVLDDVAQEEAEGRRRHTLSNAASRDLLSEGLFSSTMGRMQFRHALLRDFAIAQWALAMGSPNEVVDRVATITSRLTRFGVLRALTEASLDTSAVLEAVDLNELLRAIANRELLDEEAIAIAELEDPASIDFVALIDAVPAGKQAPFAIQVVRAGRLASNTAWLPILGRLPEQAVWAQSTSWVEAEFVVEAAGLLATERSAGSAASADAARVAVRLREWTRAARYDVAFASEGSEVVPALLRIVPRTHPSNETLEWLAFRGTKTRSACFWTLTQLPVLAHGAIAAGAVLNSQLLVDVYTRAAGHERDGCRLREQQSAVSVPNGDYTRIDVALMGAGANGAGGLLATHPDPFTEVSVALIAGHEYDSERERREQITRVLQKLGDLDLGFEPSSQARALEQAARNAAADESLPEYPATDEMVEGSPSRPYWDLHDHSLKGLLAHLRRLVRESLQGDGVFFDRIFLPAVLRGWSLVCKLLVLDVLTRDDQPRRPDALAEFLSDARLYLRDEAHPYLQRAIRSNWVRWDPDLRSRVVANIRRSAVGDRGNVYNAGPLLAAIPAEDRPAALAPLIDLYTAQGMHLDLEEPATPRTYRGSSSTPPTAPAIDGLSIGADLAWRELEMLDVAACDSVSGEEWERYRRAVRRLAPELPPATGLVGRASGVEVMGRIVRRCTREAEENGIPLADVEVILHWALQGVSAFGPSDVNDGCRPLGKSEIDLPERSKLWVAFVGLCDSALWADALAEQQELHEEFFRRVDHVVQAPADRIAWWVLSEITGWFRCRGVGKPLLTALLMERVRHGVALALRLGILEAFEHAEQVALLRHWLTENVSPPITFEETLLREAGQHVGWAALMQYGDGRTSGSHELIEELMAAPSAAGLLSDAANHLKFVGQVVFGLKTAVAGGGVPVARAAEYAALLGKAWRALGPSLESMRSGRRPAFALWAFHVVLDDPFDPAQQAEGRIQPADVPQWWACLRDVAKAVAEEGPSWEVDALVRQLRGEDAVRVVGYADALAILQLIAERTRPMTVEELDPYWRMALDGVAELCERVANLPNAPIEQLFALASEWGGPPLSIERAAAAARRIRGGV